MSKKVEDILRVVQAETIAGGVVAKEENLNENIIEVTQDELAFLAKNGHQVKILYNDGSQSNLHERPMCYDETVKQLSLSSDEFSQMLNSVPSNRSSSIVEVTNTTLDVAESNVAETDPVFNESGKKVVEKIDKNDPRSRLHFIKYVKKDDTTIKYWECGICGKEFKHQYTLMRHLPIHTDERNYKCDVCGLAFRQLSTLKQHKMRHSDARPYVCEICQKTFSRVSILISHKETHSEEKRHQCPHCNKAFRQKGNLKTHVNVHFNSRPWKCDICGEGFNQKSNLAIHKKTTHSDDASSNNKNGSVGLVEEVEGSPDQVLLASEQIHLQLNNSDQVVLQYSGVSLKSEPSPAKAVNQLNVTNRSKKTQLTSPRNKQSKPKSDDTKTYFGNSRGQALLTDNAGIIVSPIETKAMSRAVARGQTPYALLRPARGAPVLVKVLPAPHRKHMLVPANVDDLASAGSVSGAGRNGTVQLKVPVVASVIQRVRADGTISITIEPPGTKEDTIENDADAEYVEDQQNVIANSSDSLVESDDVMVQGGDVMVQSGDFTIPEYVIYSGDQENGSQARYVARGQEMIEARQQDQHVIYIDQVHEVPGDSGVQHIVVDREVNHQFMVEGEINHQVMVEGEVSHQIMVESDSNQALYLQESDANAVVIAEKTVAYIQQDGEEGQEDGVVQYLQHGSYELGGVTCGLETVGN